MIEEKSFSLESYTLYGKETMYPLGRGSLGANAHKVEYNIKNYKIVKKIIKVLGNKNSIVVYSCEKFREGMTSFHAVLDKIKQNQHYINVTIDTFVMINLFCFRPKVHRNLSFVKLFIRV